MTEPAELRPGPEDARTEPRAECTDPVGTHRPTIVWLHGIGQEPAELPAVAARLQLAEAGRRGVYPYGPVRTISPATGAPVRVWYPQNVFALDQVDLPGLLAVRRRLSGLVTREAARISADRVLLAGFSQGALVALTVGLCHP